MLSESIKTAFVSGLTAWSMLYLVACAVRCKTLYGTVSLTRFFQEFWGSLLNWFAASLAALAAWYPVAALIALAIFVWAAGLKEIAAISLVSAVITQHWRYDFPCIPILRVLIGWDLASVTAHRALILPIPALALLSLSFWGLAGGSFLFFAGTRLYGIGVILVAVCCLAITLNETLRRALTLERIAGE